MPPSGDMPNESFRDLVLRLRGRTGLTQRELATRVGLHVTSIQGWEAGGTFPGVARLQALIAVGLQDSGFTAGHERTEAEALWAAALRDAPRFRTPFDDAWFERIAPGPHHAARDEVEDTAPSAAEPHGAAREAGYESWGEAPDVAGFLNRASERETLRQWVMDEGSRLVAVLGLGGIGKSLLATRLAQDVAPSFERIFWRSLRDAPTPDEWLTEALGFLAPGDARETGAEAALVRRLLERLGETRCLLVLDNVETVLQPGDPSGAYRTGYERYGTLLQQVAEAPHRSCLVVTSREEPAELRPLRGAHGPVRALELAGFGSEDGRALLQDKGLDGDDHVWNSLVERYGGNCLALKVVGETAHELFGGSIADYLEFAAATSGAMVGGVRQLLGSQVARLSALEVEMLRRLAVEREPVSIVELATDLGPRFGRGAVLDAVEGLRRRSLLERTEWGPLFSLHSVVLEFSTEQLIEEFAHELVSSELDLLLRQPLLKATAKEYVRRSQERLIGAPIMERLIEGCGGARAAERRLVSLLDRLRGRQARDQGYASGNLVNLLRLLRGDLKGVDLSGLSLRQVYLQDIEAQGASLAGAYLAETILGEAFSFPISVALGGDGSTLVVGTASGEVCLWRVADRTLRLAVQGHTGPVTGVALTADGRLLASSSEDGGVRLWDATTGRPLATLQGHVGVVWGVALSADGQLVASGGADETVRLWEAPSGRPLAILSGHRGGVVTVALSVDRRLVASSGHDGTVRLWEAPSGQPLATLRGHTGMARGLALSADGRIVASSGADGTVRLWEAPGGRALAILRGHTGLVRGLALSADGRLVASGGYDGTVRLWEAPSGRLLANLPGHTGEALAVALSPDGRLLASVSQDGTVRLWEAPGGRPLATSPGYSAGVVAVALAADGHLLASGGHDGTVRLWESDGDRPLATLRGHAGLILAVALSADGRLVASSGYDGTVRLWEAPRGRPITTLQGHTGGVRGVALSADGRLVASGGYDGTVRLWDAPSGRPLTTLQGHTGLVLTVALARDGTLLASGGYDGTVRLWEVPSGRPLATLEGHASGVWGLALSAGGWLVASSSSDGTVRLWDAPSGRSLATLSGHKGGVVTVALSADGRLVASGGYDGAVQLWEAQTGRPLATLPGRTGGAMSVALAAEGRLLASGSLDGTVRLWDASNGALRHTLRAERRYEALDITGLTGVTEAQRQALLALGAIDRGGAG